LANNSGKNNRRLPDMAVTPDPDTYRAPGCPPAEEFLFHAEVARGHKFTVRQRIYRGKIVDFAVQQIMLMEDDVWVEVARIDCCRGTVHRHQFNRDGVDVWDHRVIREIPERGWDVVNQSYDQAYDVMVAEWEENVRRWEDVRPA
jgi:hypothetical protein